MLHYDQHPADHNVVLFDRIGEASLAFDIRCRGCAYSTADLNWCVHFKRAGASVIPNRELVGADFSEYVNRVLLAELGYFSVDLKPHRAKRERQALIKRYLEEAYDVAGLDRNEQHELIAAKMEATKTDGVWAKPTGEYAQACRRLDNFMLRNIPAIEQSVCDLETDYGPT